MKKNGVEPHRSGTTSHGSRICKMKFADPKFANEGGSVGIAGAEIIEEAADA